MITMLAASLCLPLTATAQSRYTQQDRYTQNTHSPKNHTVVKVVKPTAHYTQRNQHHDRQVVSQNHVRHGTVNKDQHSGLPVEAIALSAIAVLAAVGLSRR